MPDKPLDYYHTPASSFGRVQIDSVSTRLVLLHVGTFVLDRILTYFHVFYYGPIDASGQMTTLPPVLGLGPFSFGLAYLNSELWRWITWPFVHVSATHLLINMAGLHFFAPILESHYGSRRFFVFYVLCSAGAPLAYLIMWETGQLITDPWVMMFSASGPVLAVLVAAVHIAPRSTALIYGILPVKLRTLAIGLIAFVLYGTYYYAWAAMPSLVNPDRVVKQYGGIAAHLGSAAVALLLIRAPQWVRLLEYNPFRRPPPF